MKKRIRLKGRIRTYIQFTLYLGLLLLAIDAAVFMLDFRAGLLTFGFTIFYFAITLTLYFYNKPIIMNELISFATEYGQIQRKLLRDLELPYALLDDSGKVIWTNIAFENVVHQPKGYNKSITSLFPTITRDRLPDDSGVDEAQYELEYEGCEYVAKFRKISLKEMAEHSDMIDAEGYNGYLIAVYLFDETALHIALQEVDDQSLTVGMIYLDNYEEALESVEEVRRSLLIALIDRKVNKYIASLDGISKKLEKDKYLVIMRKKAVAQLQESRFDLLEEVKTVNIGNEMAVTISIGIGLDGLTYAQNYEFARTAIDLALGRGGDQAVIKDRFNFDFYGGRSKETEYRSKVRSRVTANSIMELIAQSDHVFIMGHRNADLDSLGAAVGINCLCRKKGKKASIVIDVNNNACPRLLDELRNVPEYRDVFISGQDALLDCDNKSILIVVDTNRPDQVEFQPLLEAISKVCVVDHHRRAADYINPVVVNLHETYASSASELVTELVSYAVESRDVLPIEAKSLMAGICLDTKFFNVRTGERTFEAAAVLRRMGADTTEVKLLLQNDFHDTLEKYQIIKEAKLYRDDLAIAALEQTTNRILAAQAADELLNISGITASFVLYPDGDVTIISARSIGTANVQMILEPLGGGGNAATAGAQMQGVSVKDALDKLIASIDAFYEE